MDWMVVDETKEEKAELQKQLQKELQDLKKFSKDKAGSRQPTDALNKAMKSLEVCKECQNPGGEKSQQSEQLQKEAMQALNDMVLAGRSVLPLLEEEINRPADPDLEKKFKDALAGMDDPDFAKRAAAAKALSGLGPEVVPLAKRVLANNDGLSVEVEKTLKNLADQIEKGSGARVDQSRTNRLHRLLALIGSDEANKLKETLPEPQLVVDPSIQGQGNKARAVPGVIEMDLGGAAGGAVFKLEGGVLKGEAMAIPVRPAVPKVPAEPKKEEKPGK